MKTRRPTDLNLKKSFARQVLRLWPALKGSLNHVVKPCIRPTCPACARGDKHPAWLLAFTEGGRRRCRYVPLALVPRLQQALKNGRRLEQILYQMGPALIKQYRQQTRPTAPAPRKRHAKS